MWTPKRVALLGAICGVVVCATGHWWIGGTIIVLAAILWLIDGLTL